MQRGVRKVFSEVPHTYELVNHILTFGMDIFWRKKTAKLAAIEGGSAWIDICSGTGEMAEYLCRLAGKKTLVVAADFSMPMISKAVHKPAAHQIVFIISDASALPFRDKVFDLVSISFATRNINFNRKALIQHIREFYRILKPGGRFVNLETSQPPWGMVKRLFHFYARIMVKPVGQIISGSKDGYSYLSHTIPRFYNAREFADIIEQTGFKAVKFHHIMFGVVAIHMALK